MFKIEKKMKKIRFIIKKVKVTEPRRRKYLQKKNRIKLWWSLAFLKYFQKRKFKRFKKLRNFKLWKIKLNDSTKRSHIYFYMCCLFFFKLIWKPIGIFDIYEFSRMRIYMDKQINTDGKFSLLIEEIPEYTIIDEADVFKDDLNKEKDEIIKVFKEEEEINLILSEIKYNIYQKKVIKRLKRKLKFEENYEKFFEKGKESIFTKFRFSILHTQLLFKYNMRRYFMLLYLKKINKYQEILSKLIWFFTMILIYFFLLKNFLIPLGIKKCTAFFLFIQKLKINILRFIKIFLEKFEKIRKINKFKDKNLIYIIHMYLESLIESFFFNSFNLNIGYFYEYIYILCIKEIPINFLIQSIYIYFNLILNSILNF